MFTVLTNVPLVIEMLVFLRHSNENLYLEQARTLQGCSVQLNTVVSARVSSTTQCSRLAVTHRPCRHGVHLAERGSGFLFWDSKTLVAINKSERGWAMVYTGLISAVESIKTVEERSIAVQTRLVLGIELSDVCKPWHPWHLCPEA